MPLEPGFKTGRLTVLSWDRSPKNSRVRYLCSCECGRTTVVDASNLNRKSRGTKSCGCYAKEQTSSRSIKHGQSFSPTHNSWSSMNERCSNPNHPSWPRYGGRGIAVCERWKGDHGYENFAADMGPRPSGTTLDRIDNDGNYEPSNCRWATIKDQCRNTSRNRPITIGERTMLLAEWAEYTGLSKQVIRYRINAGFVGESIIGPYLRKRCGR